MTPKCSKCHLFAKKTHVEPDDNGGFRHIKWSGCRKDEPILDVKAKLIYVPEARGRNNVFVPGGMNAMTFAFVKAGIVAISASAS